MKSGMLIIHFFQWHWYINLELFLLQTYMRKFEECGIGKAGRQHLAWILKYEFRMQHLAIASALALYLCLQI